MASYKVLIDGTVTRSEIFNPYPGQIRAEFHIPEPATPFNPLTFLTDGRSDEAAKLDAETKAQAEEWLRLNPLSYPPADEGGHWDYGVEF